jgi:hypothetical protein
MSCVAFILGLAAALGLALVLAPEAAGVIETSLDGGVRATG